MALLPITNQADVTHDEQKVTSGPSSPGINRAQAYEEQASTDVTDVKIGKVKKFEPNVEDLPENYVCYVYQPGERQGTAQPPAGLNSTDVTPQNAEVTSDPAKVTSVPAWLEEDETPNAKQRALQKQWPVDPPHPSQTRAAALLECLPEDMRTWNVCFEAAQKYAAAEEPPYVTDLWGRGKQTNQHKPLWTILGQALATRDAPMHAAIDVLNHMRSSL